MSTQFTNRQWRLPNNENKDKQSNYSMNFDSSSSDYIQIPYNVNLTPQNGNFTISAWINTNNLSGWHPIWCTQNLTSSTVPLVALHTYGNKVRATVGGSTNNPSYAGGWALLLDSTQSLTTSTWYHIAVTFNMSGNAQIYINGSADNSGPIENPQTSWNTGDRFIGEGEGYWDGKIDGVSIFNYALSSSQVTTLYGSSSTGIGNPMSLSPKPVAYYPLGDQDAFNGASYLTPNASLKDFVFNNTNSSAINTPYNLTATSNITVAIWFKTTTNAQSNKYLFSYGNSSSIYDFRLNGTDSVQPIITLAGVQRYPSISFNYADGNWHQYVVNYDGSHIKVYIDGILKNKSSYSGDLSVSTNNFVFANLSSTSSGGVVGEVSNCTIHTATLTDGNVSEGNVATGEIATFYNYGSPIKTLSSIPKNSNLALWYKLDASATYDSSTTTWTIEDSSSNSNTGTSSGMTQANLVQSDLSFTSGYSPYALAFDSASSDYITLTNNINLGSTMTFSVWLKTDHVNPSTIQQQNDWVKNITGGEGFFRLNDLFGLGLSNGRLANYVSNTSGAVGFALSTNPLNDNIWHHCFVTFNGSTLKSYIDGNLNVTIEGITTWTSNIIKTIGRYDSASIRYFDGILSNMAVWNSTLTASQGREIYNEGLPSDLNTFSGPAPVAWWQLGSNSSFNTNWTVLNEISTGPNGTSSNMTEADIVDGVGSYANGLSSGMGGDEVIGDAPYSTANSLSVNMDVEDRVTDTPS